MEAKVIQTIIEVIKGDITKNNHLRSISIPNISTGIYRYPKKEAANVAIHTVVEFINRNESISHVQFVCLDDENYEIYEEILESYV
ncbi:macro domain-containing protein [Paenibacillus barcinonensis]|uniref:Macro domain-containing protein n=1 Tax=Paenibacillus barcinonensis TaxID=198119 RepID=A0A2V4VP74_PAEBA|nr:macro domain-containing protein [Paenibacillus barcinonensis]PYE47903.1 macro domain-containing protein [Paenibacillus barcinonensis]QKS59015.1 macro domain-containing protein [Paenibacillus barcinonensis]